MACLIEPKESQLRRNEKHEDEASRFDTHKPRNKTPHREGIYPSYVNDNDFDKVGNHLNQLNIPSKNQSSLPQHWEYDRG